MPLGDKNILSSMCKENKKNYKCIPSTSRTFIDYVFSLRSLIFYGEAF
jgi:hypothetical protein